MSPVFGLGSETPGLCPSIDPMIHLAHVPRSLEYGVITLLSWVSPAGFLGSLSWGQRQSITCTSLCMRLSRSDFSRNKFIIYQESLCVKYLYIKFKITWITVQIRLKINQNFANFSVPQVNVNYYPQLCTLSIIRGFLQNQSSSNTANPRLLIFETLLSNRHRNLR